MSPVEVRIRISEERRWKNSFFIGIFNAFLSCCLAIRHPFAFGQCQIVRAKEFRAVGGYNNYQVHAEDSAS